jgi:hypothetical protein
LKRIQPDHATALKESDAHSLDHAIGKRATVARYGARYWAVYLDADLLAVTVYKKGALAVQALLSQILFPKRK